MHMRREGINQHQQLHGPLARYAKLRVAHAPGMPGTFSPPPLVNDPDMHHGTCVTHVSYCMPGSLTSGLLCSRWRGKRSRHPPKCMCCMHRCVPGDGNVAVIMVRNWLISVSGLQLKCFLIGIWWTPLVMDYHIRYRWFKSAWFACR